MKKTARTLVYCLFALQLLSLTAWSQGLPETTPEPVGLSQKRLANITAFMQKHVDEKKLAGAVAVVARPCSPAGRDDSVLAEKMKKLARIPLLHNPGEAWTYGLSVDVLGRV